MCKKITALLLAVLLVLLPACSPRAGADEDNTITIVATTYPVYLFVTAITEGINEAAAPGDNEFPALQVELLVNEATSCLHDYTLTVRDMKLLEKADVIVLNGAGLEEFLEDALARSQAILIDCSAGVELLDSDGHHHDHGHDDGSGEDGHSHEDDPHIWLSLANAARMLQNIADGLTALDPDRAGRYRFNLESSLAKLEAPKLRREKLNDLTRRELVTFHEGFSYLAEECGLTVLKAIEEEEGATASAAELKEIIDLVREHELTAIFTERNGSAASAQTVARETGVLVRELDMIMSGDGTGLGPYLAAMERNYETIIEGLGA